MFLPTLIAGVREVVVVTASAGLTQRDEVAVDRGGTKDARREAPRKNNEDTACQRSEAEIRVPRAASDAFARRVPTGVIAIVVTTATVAVMMRKDIRCLEAGQA
jgi:hypothetical protein